MDSDFMNNLATAMKNGNIPNDIKNLMNNMKNNSSVNNQDTINNDNQNVNENTSYNTSDSNKNINNINPDMLKNIMNLFNSSSKNDTSNNSSDFNSDNVNSNGSIPNFDINMLLKMKSIMDKLNNNKNDPRSNLLLSLKPYLKESRKNRVEQYIQFINMSKIIEVFNQNGGENIK